jgi:hypothetical protein
MPNIFLNESFPFMLLTSPSITHLVLEPIQWYLRDKGTTVFGEKDLLVKRIQTKDSVLNLLSSK